MPDRPLADWLSRLEQLHPTAIDLGLDRVRRVALTLGLLPVASSSVIVAGTNGKGSVVGVLEQVLVACGASVGVYTSPHLVDYNERIRIDGISVTDAAIVRAFTAIDAARGDVSLTYFEFGTLAALWLFREAGVAYQILEVGLGGRLDAVNIVDADVAVITSIGLDHQEWLGDTREAIAIEKAHVARAGHPVIVIEPDPPDTLLTTLDALSAQALWLGRDFFLADGTLTTTVGERLALPVAAGLLDSNIAGALQALALLVPNVGAQLPATLPPLRVPGRCEMLVWQGADLVLDVAHNLESAEVLRHFLARSSLALPPPRPTTHGVYASLADKPHRDILRALSEQIDHWYFPAFPGVARAVDPKALGDPDDASSTQCFDDFATAWRALAGRVARGDRVVVFGSFITVGAALERLRAEGVVTH